MTKVKETTGVKTSRGGTRPILLYLAALVFLGLSAFVIFRIKEYGISLSPSNKQFLHFNLMILGLGGLYIVVCYLLRPRNWTERLILSLGLIVLLVGSFYHTNKRNIEKTFERRQVLYWNMFHYYLGSKYFDELGYDMLYRQALAADRETDNRLNAVRKIRALEDLEKRYIVFQEDLELLIRDMEPLIEQRRQIAKKLEKLPASLEQAVTIYQRHPLVLQLLGYARLNIYGEPAGGETAPPVDLTALGREHLEKVKQQVLLDVTNAEKQRDRQLAQELTTVYQGHANRLHRRSREELIELAQKLAGYSAEKRREWFEKRLHVPASDKFIVILKRDPQNSPFSEQRWESFKKDLNRFLQMPVEVCMGDTEERRPCQARASAACRKEQQSAGVFEQCVKTQTESCLSRLAQDCEVGHRQTLENMLRDRGYNPTPFWNSVGSFVSNHLDIHRADDRLWLALFDLIFYVLILAAMIWAFGPETAMLVFILFAVMPNNNNRLVGGFLQYDWFAALIFGFCFFKKKMPILSALFFSFAVLSRVFPLIMVAGLALPVLRRLIRTGKIEKFFWKFGITLALAGVLGVAVGSFSAHGFAAWKEWREDIKVHNETHVTGGKRIGLKHIFTHEFGEAIKKRVDDVSHRRRTFDKQKDWYTTAAVVMLLVFLVALWFCTPFNAMLLSMMPVFILLVASRYYWSILALLALWQVRDDEQPWRIAFWAPLIAYGIVAEWFHKALSVGFDYAHYIYYNKLIAAGLLTLCLILIIVGIREKWLSRGKDIEMTEEKAAAG